MSTETEGVKEVRKKKKAGDWPLVLLKILLIIVELVILSPFLLLPVAILSVVIGNPLTFYFSGHHKFADWERGKYLETKSEEVGWRASFFIPSFTECSGYSSASFYWNGNEHWFEWSDYCAYSVCLDLSYDEGTYASAKEQALSSHHFLDAPVDDSYQKMSFAQTMIGGYDVRIIDENRHEWRVNEEEYLTWYPDSFGFLAFQDEKFTIRYCYIYKPFADSCDETDSLIKYLKLNFPVDWE